MRRSGSVLVALFCVALAALVPARADRIVIHSSQVPLDGDNLVRTTVGKLVYRGGLSLSSPDPRFGGLSGLVVLEGGAGIVAISDTGWWVTARLVHDEAGRLIGVRDGALGPLTDPEGRPLHQKAWADAESLAPLGDGLAVGFERHHRIWRYPYGATPFATRPVPLPAPAGLDRAPANLGLEALTALPGNRLFALTEGLESGSGMLRGWIGEGPGVRTWHAFDWVRHGLYAPSGAATLPDGGVLVLERRFTLIGGLGVRVLRLAPGAIRPGARVDGHPIATFDPPVTVDNFEGIDVVPSRGGGPLDVYLVSDDNYNPLQRTLLMEFALRP